MQITIPIHSIVDVITNSSSVIYTEATDNAIQIAKSIVDEILALGGSDKTADDLYDFKYQVLPDDVLDWALDDAESGLEGIPDPDGITAFENLKPYEVRRKAAQVWVDKNRKELYEWFNEQGVSDWDDYPRYTQNLIITTKDGVEFPFSDKVLSMFSQSASYDG